MNNSDDSHGLFEQNQIMKNALEAIARLSPSCIQLKDAPFYALEALSEIKKIGSVTITIKEDVNLTHSEIRLIRELKGGFKHYHENEFKTLINVELIQEIDAKIFITEKGLSVLKAIDNKLTNSIVTTRHGKFI